MILADSILPSDASKQINKSVSDLNEVITRLQMESFPFFNRLYVVYLDSVNKSINKIV